MSRNKCKGCEGNAIGYPHTHKVNTTQKAKRFFCEDHGIFTATVPTHIVSARCQCGVRCTEATKDVEALFHALNAY